MNAGDIMTRKVVSVAPDASVDEAVRTMLRREVSGLPVVDAEGRLVGIVTEGDFLRRVETGTERQRPRWLAFLAGSGRLAADYVESHARRVDEIMTPDVAACGAETPLADVVAMMERYKVKRIPVVEGGRLVGIVSRADILRALAGMLRQPAVPAGDDELERRLGEAIAAERWTPVGSTRVEVKDGIAHLHGVVLDERQREALCVLAEGVPGIRGVSDHLVWVEPYSGTAIEGEGIRGA